MLRTIKTEEESLDTIEEGGLEGRSLEDTLGEGDERVWARRSLEDTPGDEDVWGDEPALPEQSYEDRSKRASSDRRAANYEQMMKKKRKQEEMQEELDEWNRNYLNPEIEKIEEENRRRRSGEPPESSLLSHEDTDKLLEDTFNQFSEDEKTEMLKKYKAEQDLVYLIAEEEAARARAARKEEEAARARAEVQQLEGMQRERTPPNNIKSARQLR